MALSANTLGDTANTLMSQLATGTITFESYKTSMNSVIESTNNNSDFDIDSNSDAAHTVSIAIRLAKGEAPSLRKK